MRRVGDWVEKLIEYLIAFGMITLKSIILIYSCIKSYKINATFFCCSCCCCLWMYVFPIVFQLNRFKSGKTTIVRGAKGCRDLVAFYVTTLCECGEYGLWIPLFNCSMDTTMAIRYWCDVPLGVLMSWTWTHIEKFSQL